MTQIVLNVPASLDHYSGHLISFFQAMLFKLDLNSHKDRPERPDVPVLAMRMMGEVGELATQLDVDQLDPNALMEAADSANFAFLISVALADGGTEYPDYMWRFKYQPRPLTPAEEADAIPF